MGDAESRSKCYNEQYHCSTLIGITLEIALLVVYLIILEIVLLVV